MWARTCSRQTNRSYRFAERHGLPQPQESHVVVVRVDVEISVTHNRRHHSGDRVPVRRRTLVVIAEYDFDARFFQPKNTTHRKYTIKYYRRNTAIEKKNLLKKKSRTATTTRVIGMVKYYPVN